MPCYEFECPACFNTTEVIASINSDPPSCSCGTEMFKVLSTCAIIISENIGRKLKTRVNLDNELKKQGFDSPLFSNETEKDKAKWALKKEGLA